MPRFPIVTSILLFLSLALFALQPAEEFSQGKIVGSNHAVILQYHHISVETPDSTSLSPEIFLSQMNYLESNDFKVWPLSKVVSLLESNQPIPDKVVAISFDDAYKSVYTNAFPILKEKNFPFTIFLSTHAVRNEINQQYITWQEIKEMMRHGASIGNHTVNHLHLVRKLEGENTSNWKKRIKQEILEAEEIILFHTGASEKLLAYPYGEFNPELKRLVSKLGYTGFGQHSGAAGPLSDRQALPRFPLSNDFSNMEDFADKVYSLPLPVLNTIPEIHELQSSNSRPRIEVYLQPGIVSVENVQCFASRQGKIITEKIKGGFSVQANTDLPSGRSRYNCTLPSKHKKSGLGGSRFFWYSIPFYRKNPDGTWYID